MQQYRSTASQGQAYKIGEVSPTGPPRYRLKPLSPEEATREAERWGPGTVVFALEEAEEVEEKP